MLFNFFSGNGPSRLRKTGAKALHEVLPWRSKLFPRFFVSNPPIPVTSRRDPVTSKTRRASGQNPPANGPGEAMTSSTHERPPTFPSVTATPAFCDRPTKIYFSRPEQKKIKCIISCKVQKVIN